MKLGEAVIGAYKRVEDGVADGYKKVEDAFVDRFLERTGNETKDPGATRDGGQ